MFPLVLRTGRLAYRDGGPVLFRRSGAASFALPLKQSKQLLLCCKHGRKPEQSNGAQISV